MKKLISLLLFACIIAVLKPNIVKASGSYMESPCEIVYLENGDFIKTTIESIPKYNTISSQSTNTITKTKIAKYKNKKGKILWSVSVTATFAYNGISSQCTRYYYSASVPAKTWSIKSISSYKNGNSATAVAIATHTNEGQSQDIVKSLTIQCSSTGTVS